MRFLVLASVLMLLAGRAHADTTHDALSEITKCAEVADPAARLRCFDAAVPRVKGALAERQATEKRSFLDWFGFARPPKPVTKPEDFGKSAQSGPEEITAITATVVEFAKTARGRAVFFLDNGQLWRQLDGDDTVVLEPPSGKTMKVTIATGMLGNYNLTVEGRNALVRVRRMK